MGGTLAEVMRMSPLSPGTPPPDLRLSSGLSPVGAPGPGPGLDRISPTAGGVLKVLPALRDLLPRGGLARGSVVAIAEFGLLCLALAAGASADGAWCAIAGVPEVGVLAAVGLGLDADRTLIVPDPGPAWPQVVASLLDGCELVLLRSPARAPATVQRRLEATLRRAGGVLLVAGDWPGAQLCLRVGRQRWTGLGDGRGEATRTRTHWLWLPAEDGRVAAVDPADLPLAEAPLAGDPPRLRAVGAR